jgi:MoxR-like ATPase
METQMTSPKLSLVDAPELSPREKFVKIGACLRASYVERESAVEAVLLAALSGSHALLVGPPGTGKSALFFGFLSSFVDAKQFQTLVTKFGSEDEYFGPPKLSALKNDRWERNLEGRLAAVDCAFLDEVFKGSDSVLNSFLSAMNERLYKGAPIPLRLLVGASNELPEEEILAAIYDRFLIRDVVEYIESDATWMRVVSAPPTYRPTVHLTMSEWDAALAEVSLVTLPEPVVREMLRVKKALAAAGITISDRRWIASTKVLKAAAWLDGCPAVELDHLAALRFCLWVKPDDRAAVKSVLGTIDQSAVVKCTEIIDEALRAFANRPLDQAEYHRVLPGIAAQLQDASKAVQAQVKQGVTKRARGRIQPKLDELKVAYDSLKADLAKRFDLG